MWPAWATERVEIHPPDDAWSVSGERECGRLNSVLAPWLVAPVEHIGSTAVPGLAAKPILDLQAVVDDLGCGAQVAAVLAEGGWHHVPPELDRRPWRSLFVRVEGGHRAAHLHLLLRAHPRWRQQLAFRDALRADPGLAQRYAAIKLTLARHHPDDREAYTAAKADFVLAVLRHHEAL